MELKLWEKEIPYYDAGADTPNKMTTYFVETDKPLPCIVIYPGGGYGMRAYHEGEPIAKFFNSRGMHAVVVDYRVSPNRYPAELADAQRAIKIVRARANEWKIDPNKVVTLGFSAGGHLAASTVTLDDVTVGCHEHDEIDDQSALPNGAILCYPVISIKDDFGHAGSGMNLLGDKYKFESDYFSLQNRVTDKTPTCFFWHTSDDSAVNIKNSLIFAGKLRDHKIPFEMHVYPHGPHGLGLAENYDDASQWPNQAADWVWRNI
ncbi:MAG: alpha/beta hydrolase [Clostridiales bacterium]|nr:alpha/beta hydrolase [Clostridiales bacterium]